MAIIDKIQLSGTVYTIGNETTTAVTSASTDNEIPTAKAVYDAIPQGGGGKAVSGGTNISITTGDTADTINCTLPISTTSSKVNLTLFGNSQEIQNSYSVNFGYSNSFGINPTWIYNYGTSNSTPMYGNKYYVNFGENNSLEGYGFEYTFGNYLKSVNKYEFACGKYNKSNSGTLFSVGNGTGTSSSARHNAFEIRQNGDIYISKDGQDVKLQDQFGGGGSITIDPSLDSGSTNPVANSAITNAINDRQLKREYVGSEKVFTSSDIINRREILCPMFRCYSNNSTNTELVLENKDLGLYFPTVNGKNIFSTNKYETNWLGDVIETSAITTSVTSSSTDTQVPSAKAVYDIVGNIETLLSKI